MITITDLFSHKIHSSRSDWGEKLIEIATVFSKFDDQIYDRELIEKELQKISPRVSSVARDPSKFRDEISAYPAYLGVFRLELKKEKWHVIMSKTAKRLLLSEEPDVASFMTLQMCMFQYPNGMGAAYRSNSSKVRIQANSRDRTLALISGKICFSPFRLICAAIYADKLIRRVSLDQAKVSFSEVFALANHPRTNSRVIPDLLAVCRNLKKIRNGVIKAPERFESRFHILDQTDFLETSSNYIRIDSDFALHRAEQTEHRLRSIIRCKAIFDGFDEVTDESSLQSVIHSSKWGRYFDAYTSLSESSINAILGESLTFMPPVCGIKEVSDSNAKGNFESCQIYEFRELGENFPAFKNPKVTRISDPEVTKLLRQRANLEHRLILDKLSQYLKSIGVQTFENEHIDLYAKISEGTEYIFEVKSINKNLLSQSRKAISQLYEYRFRYRERLGSNVFLCLVLPEEPSNIPWLQEYVCSDRNIALIWFSDEIKLECSNFSEPLVKPLRRSA